MICYTSHTHSIMYEVCRSSCRMQKNGNGAAVIVCALQLQESRNNLITPVCFVLFYGEHVCMQAGHNTMMRYWGIYFSQQLTILGKLLN